MLTCLHQRPKLHRLRSPVWLLFLCHHVNPVRRHLCPSAGSWGGFCGCPLVPVLLVPFVLSFAFSLPGGFHGWEQHLWPLCALTAATLTCQALECMLFFFFLLLSCGLKETFSCVSAHCSQLANKVLLIFYYFIYSTLMGVESQLCMCSSRE